MIKEQFSEQVPEHFSLLILKNLKNDIQPLEAFSTRSVFQHYLEHIFESDLQQYPDLKDKILRELIRKFISKFAQQNRQKG